MSVYRHDKLNIIHNENAYSGLIYLPENSIDLVITSPPYYGAGKEYEDYKNYGEYEIEMRKIFKELFRKVKEGGRICVNVANMGRTPYEPLSHWFADYLDCAGFNMRGEIIWNKAASVGSSTAWGSWQSASNPTLRDVHEYILVYSKKSYKRNERGKSTISREEFLEYTKSIWTFPTESAKRIKHPAPFPIELPYRLIQLYSYEGDVILDPFMGSGTTAIAAIKTGRNYIGFEKEREYVNLANQRIFEYNNKEGNKK